jgi:cytochrome P450
LAGSAFEPVVGALYRRTERELKLEGEGGTTTIPAGTLVKVDVRATNTNSVAAGRCPFQLDTDRNVLARKASMGHMGRICQKMSRFNALVESKAIVAGTRFLFCQNFIV